jgi:hypothetical protein
MQTLAMEPRLIANPVRNLHNAQHHPGKGGKKTVDLIVWHGRIEKLVEERTKNNNFCIDVYTQK